MTMDQSLMFPLRSFRDSAKSTKTASACVSRSERERIERATLDQSTEALWFEQRKCRLTASNLGTVARRRQTTTVGKLVKNLLYDTLREARSLQWGREHEPDARQAYLQTKGTNYLLTHSGLVIHAEHGWLVCSPDDLVQDSSAEQENQHGLVWLSTSALTLLEIPQLKNPAKRKILCQPCATVK